jgi:hypothetical protein
MRKTQNPLTDVAVLRLYMYSIRAIGCCIDPRLLKEVGDLTTRSLSELMTWSTRSYVINFDELVVNSKHKEC